MAGVVGYVSALSGADLARAMVWHSMQKSEELYRLGADCCLYATLTTSCLSWQDHAFCSRLLKGVGSDLALIDRCEQGLRLTGRLADDRADLKLHSSLRHGRNEIETRLNEYKENVRGYVVCI